MPFSTQVTCTCVANLTAAFQTCQLEGQAYVNLRGDFLRNGVRTLLLNVKGPVDLEMLNEVIEPLNITIFC